MKIIRLLILSMLLLPGTQVTAAENMWQLDAAHSSVSFRVNHVLAKVVGVFEDYDVRVTLNPEDLEGSNFYIEVKTDSVNTLLAKRDKHLKAADFFDARKFPLITFQSKTVTDQGDGLLTVQGTLTVKEKEYAMTLPVQYLGLADHPMKKGSQVIGLNIETTLDRLAYGIGNGSFFKKGLVGKDVEVLISLEMLNK